MELKAATASVSGPIDKAKQHFTNISAMGELVMFQGNFGSIRQRVKRMIA